MKLEGISIVKVEQLFKVIPTIPELKFEVTELTSKTNDKIQTEDGDVRKIKVSGATVHFENGIGIYDTKKLFAQTPSSAIAQIATSATSYVVAGCGISGTTLKVLCKRADTGANANNVDIELRFLVVGTDVPD